MSLALRTVIEDLSPSEIADFIRAVTGSDTDDGLDLALRGPPPSGTEAVRAHLTTSRPDTPTVGPSWPNPSPAPKPPGC